MRIWTHDQVQLLFLAAKDLREAQRDYLSGRTQEKGARVGMMSAHLDSTLQNLMRVDTDTPYPNPEHAHHLVEACLAMRLAQHKHIAAGVFSSEAAKEAGVNVGLAADLMDRVIAEIKDAEEAPGPSL